MSESSIRLSQAAKKFNVSITTIQNFLSSKGFEVDTNPNSKIGGEQLLLLEKQFAADKAEREEANEMTIGMVHQKANLEQDTKNRAQTAEESFEPRKPVERKEEIIPKKASEPEPEIFVSSAKPEYKVLGKVDLNPPQKVKTETPKTKPTEAKPTPAKKEASKVTQTKPKAPKEKKAEQTSPANLVTEPQEATVSEPSVELHKEQSQINNAQTARVETIPAETIEQKAKAETENVILEKTLAPVEEFDLEENPSKLIHSSENELIEAKADRLQGLKILGKIDLPVSDKNKKGQKPVASSDDKERQKKRKRLNKTPTTQSGQNPQNQQGGQHQQGQNKANPNYQNRSQHNNSGANSSGQNRPQQNHSGQNRPNPQQNQQNRPASGQQQGDKKKPFSQNPNNNNNFQGRRNDNNQNQQPQAKDTKSLLVNKREHRKKKRIAGREARERQAQLDQDEANILRVTEFISANDLATMMEVSVNEIIKYCFTSGMAVSINSRLDADSITIIASEFGFDVEFISAEEEIEAALEEVPDQPEDLVPRAPIVTIMGHVDHGKTSLLDYIRKSKVAEGEAGGITQHIGAYDVMTPSGRRVVFLDTPGHEAFTSMRARGAKLTDVAVIVIAADDSIMPQTDEAISHAQVAGVDIVFAINKIDKPGANPEKIKEQLAQRNILVESWGGKYPCQEISAKFGTGVDDLLELIILSADIKELKANPNKPASGTIIESSLDKGRGYVSNVLVQAGTLKVGDIILAGSHFGKVKAMLDKTGNRLKSAGPSTPVQILGFDGAPQAGDKIVVTQTEREAREIAQKRAQIQREQSIRATRRTTLSDIGRRLALGYQRLNIIIKGDVDGSVEALSGSLLKLSTEEIEVFIIHKAVGAISESDVLLASASDAIIIGFQVRPTSNAKKIAESEGVEIRHYSIIYDAINDVKDALEGMLQPKFEENVVGTVEVRAVFKLSKAGTVAGSYVLSGHIKRNSKVRVVRDNIVIHEGEILALKRFKDDVSEVKNGFECGISLKNFNDIKENDIIEVFEQKEIKRTLKN
jgi:translation initiation factor IF-2